MSKFNQFMDTMRERRELHHKIDDLSGNHLVRDIRF